MQMKQREREIERERERTRDEERGGYVWTMGNNQMNNETM